jgi:hypothetical protein
MVDGPGGEHARGLRGPHALRELTHDHEHVTLFLSGRPMQEDRLFYADHFVMLPVWVQLALHDGPLDEVLACIARLPESEPN